MKNKVNKKKEGLAKYFLAGLVIAMILFIVFTLLKKDETLPEKKKAHVWAAETDSQFVKSCYDKYKPQVKDDMTKQEVTKTYCRCMLEKAKEKYEEKEMGRISNDDLKNWDSECRLGILNPMFH